MSLSSPRQLTLYSLYARANGQSGPQTRCPVPKNFDRVYRTGFPVIPLMATTDPLLPERVSAGTSKFKRFINYGSGNPVNRSFTLMVTRR